MRDIQIGLFGLGTVGAGLVEIIQRRQREWMERYGFRPVLKTIYVRHLDKPRSVRVEPALLTNDPDAILLDPEIEVVIEVIGGEEPSYHYAKTALSQGKHLITANKYMLALHGPELFRLAKEHQVEIGLEASVGGGIPIIQPIRDSLNANEIQTLTGIINGTTNYILTAMSQCHEGYFDVLAKAQVRGYAEADPTSDVDGWDACYKLSVLTGVAFGVQLPVNMIPTEGISQIALMDLRMAKELGYEIKLVAKAERSPNGYRGRVHPTLLSQDHPLASVHGVNNALLVTGDAVGEVLFYGPGAGKMATGSAVAADLVRICRLISQGTQDHPRVFSDRIPTDATFEMTSPHRSRFFITVESVHKPDIHSVENLLQENHIRVNSILMKDDTNLFYLGIVTDVTSNEDIRRIVTYLSSDPFYRKVHYYYIEGKA